MLKTLSDYHIYCNISTDFQCSQVYSPPGGNNIVKVVFVNYYLDEKYTYGLGKPNSDLNLNRHYICQPLICKLENVLVKSENRKPKCIDFNIVLIVVLCIHKKETKISSNKRLKGGKFQDIPGCKSLYLNRFFEFCQRLLVLHMFLSSILYQKKKNQRYNLGIFSYQTFAQTILIFGQPSFTSGTYHLLRKKSIILHILNNCIFIS